MTAPGRHRFEALDAWRGVAAVAVACRHVNGTSVLLANPFHDNLSRAVDFFFVLSGFVIALSYGDRLAQGFSWARFMVLRIGRVWPLHAVMVLAYVALECLLLAVGQIGSLAGREAFSGPRDLSTLPVSLFLLQAWVWPGRDLWNVQSWSVSVEIGLYVGAALLWRLFPGRALALGGGLALVLGLAYQFLPVGRIIPDDVIRGLVGFGLGMGCWALWPRMAGIAMTRAGATVIELVLVVLAALCIGFSVPMLANDLVFAAMVLVFGREQGALSSLLLTSPFRWLGILSYSLYMVHGLVFGRVFDTLAFAQSRLGADWVSAHLGGADLILLPFWPALALLVSMVTLGLACAWVAWRLIEWPARNFSRRLVDSIGSRPAPIT